MPGCLAAFSIFLKQYRPEYYWYYQENADAKMVCRLIWKKLVSILSLGRLQVKKPLVYNDMMLSYMRFLAQIYLLIMYTSLGSLSTTNTRISSGSK